ncbi:MAG TPA: helix-turn-helix transcriptional regulator [Rhodanobacteraceae bacterium]|nr:helix-turn-helix transcriptional regulator [Rhodanobacteraceae bacterium]
MKAADVNAGLDLLEVALDAGPAIDAGVALGTRKLVAHLRASVASHGACSYTITSRRYSVWTLVRTYLDVPFAKFLNGYGEAATGSKLGRFRLSEIHKTDPAPIAANHRLPVRESDFQRRYALKRRRITEWRKFFKALVRQSQVMAANAGVKGYDEFDKTLDFIQASLLFVIHEMVPSRQRPSPTDELRGSSTWNRHTRRTQTYCELCWRPTEYTLHQELSPGAVSGENKNKRFCCEHDPSDPRSKYRVDHRYRQAFHNEFKHLRRICTSEYAVRFTLPTMTTITAMRKAAYDLVHAGLHSPNANRKHRYSLKERVYVLREQGMSQADAARKLGVSRQAVSKAWQQLHEIIARHEAAMAADSQREEFLPETSVAKLLTAMVDDGRAITLSLSSPKHNVN